MAEIRVRNASPQLVKGLEAIAMEVRESTISGALIKMIPRYLDMQKRIIEQNREIAELSNKLRKYEFNESTMREQFKDYLRSLEQHAREATRIVKTFGTKTQRPGNRPAKKSGKLSTTKKRK